MAEATLRLGSDEQHAAVGVQVARADEVPHDRLRRTVEGRDVIVSPPVGTPLPEPASRAAACQSLIIRWRDISLVLRIEAAKTDDFFFAPCPVCRAE
nr:hypothetical protein [Parafrankia sp. Ea1.12]